MRASFRTKSHLTIIFLISLCYLITPLQLQASDAEGRSICFTNLGIPHKGIARPQTLQEVLPSILASKQREHGGIVMQWRKTDEGYFVPYVIKFRHPVFKEQHYAVAVPEEFIEKFVDLFYKNPKRLLELSDTETQRLIEDLRTTQPKLTELREKIVAAIPDEILGSSSRDAHALNIESVIEWINRIYQKGIEDDPELTKLVRDYIDTQFVFETILNLKNGVIPQENRILHRYVARLEAIRNYDSNVMSLIKQTWMWLRYPALSDAPEELAPRSTQVPKIKMLVDDSDEYIRTRSQEWVRLQGNLVTTLLDTVDATLSRQETTESAARKLRPVTEALDQDVPIGEKLQLLVDSFERIEDLTVRYMVENTLLKALRRRFSTDAELRTTVNNTLESITHALLKPLTNDQKGKIRRVFSLASNESFDYLIRNLVNLDPEISPISHIKQLQHLLKVGGSKNVFYLPAVVKIYEFFYVNRLDSCQRLVQLESDIHDAWPVKNEEFQAGLLNWARSQAIQLLNRSGRINIEENDNIAGLREISEEYIQHALTERGSLRSFLQRPEGLLYQVTTPKWRESFGRKYFQSAEEYHSLSPTIFFEQFIRRPNEFIKLTTEALETSGVFDVTLNSLGNLHHLTHLKTFKRFNEFLQNCNRAKNKIHKRPNRPYTHEEFRTEFGTLNKNYLLEIFDGSDFDDLRIYIDMLPDDPRELATNMLAYDYIRPFLTAFRNSAVSNLSDQTIHPTLAKGLTLLRDIATFSEDLHAQHSDIHQSIRALGLSLLIEYLQNLERLHNQYRELSENDEVRNEIPDADRGPALLTTSRVIRNFFDPTINIPEDIEIILPIWPGMGTTFSVLDTLTTILTNSRYWFKNKRGRPTVMAIAMNNPHHNGPTNINNLEGWLKHTIDTMLYIRQIAPPNARIIPMGRSASGSLVLEMAMRWGELSRRHGPFADAFIHYASVLPRGYGAAPISQVVPEAVIRELTDDERQRYFFEDPHSRELMIDQLRYNMLYGEIIDPVYMARADRRLLNYADRVISEQRGFEAAVANPSLLAEQNTPPIFGLYGRDDGEYKPLMDSIFLAYMKLFLGAAEHGWRNGTTLMIDRGVHQILRQDSPDFPNPGFVLATQLVRLFLTDPHTFSLELIQKIASTNEPIDPVHVQPELRLRGY